MLNNIHYFFLLLITISLLSCNQGEIDETDSIEEQEPEKELPRLFMASQSNHVRVRKTPDLEGANIYILSKDVLVEYLHDSTTFTTEVFYNNKLHDRNWYKIQTADKTIGWVHGGFVEFLPDEQNQKVALQRETDELLEAANEKQPQFTQKQKKELSQPVNTSLITSYQNYLNTLSKSDPNSVKAAMTRFESVFIGNNVRTCDAAYVTFHNFYFQVLAVLERGNFRGYQRLAPEIEIYKQAYMNIDDNTRLLGANGFNFGLKNGQVVLAEDVDFIYRVFYRECSTPMRAYMNQYQLEEPNFWLDNDKLLISPELLARWVLSWNFIVATYPDFILHADAKKRLEKQLNILLHGTSQTPLFSPKTNQLSEGYKIAYQHISDKYPDTKIGGAFKEYLQVLENNEWQMSSGVTQAQNKIVKRFVL